MVFIGGLNVRNMTWNKDVAASRGEAWKKKLAQGKLDSQLNPTQLKILRVARGMSQEDAAKKFKLSIATYGGIERGLRTANKNVAEVIAKSFSKTVKNLFESKAENKYIAVR